MNNTDDFIKMFETVFGYAPLAPDTSSTANYTPTYWDEKMRLDNIRNAALSIALKGREGWAPNSVIAVAKQFETYLKGE